MGKKIKNKIARWVKSLLVFTSNSNIFILGRQRRKREMPILKIKTGIAKLLERRGSSSIISLIRQSISTNNLHLLKCDGAWNNDIKGKEQILFNNSLSISSFQARTITCKIVIGSACIIEATPRDHAKPIIYFRVWSRNKSP